MIYNLLSLKYINKGQSTPNTYTYHSIWIVWMYDTWHGYVCMELQCVPERIIFTCKARKRCSISHTVPYNHNSVVREHARILVRLVCFGLKEHSSFQNMWNRWCCCVEQLSLFNLWACWFNQSINYYFNII